MTHVGAGRRHPSLAADRQWRGGHEGLQVAILGRGDHETRRSATPYNNRYRGVFEELIALGIGAQPVVYADDIGAEVRNQLLTFDCVLVWVDPIHEGQRRLVLDEILRDVAGRRPWVSAHPDVILKMGVKEVLYRTRHLGWGADTHLYRSMADFRAAFQARLRSGGPRVLKQNRGNGGRGSLEGRTGRRSAWRKASIVNVLQRTPRQRAGKAAARRVHRPL